MIPIPFTLAKYPSEQFAHILLSPTRASAKASAHMTIITTTGGPPASSFSSSFPYNHNGDHGENKVCTYENSARKLACSMCSAPKPEGSQPPSSLGVMGLTKVTHQRSKQENMYLLSKSGRGVRKAGLSLLNWIFSSAQVVKLITFNWFCSHHGTLICLYFEKDKNLFVSVFVILVCILIYSAGCRAGIWRGLGRRRRRRPG